MWDRPEFKVGSLVLISFLLVGYMSMKVAKGVSLFESTDRHELVVGDASGIIPNTAVKVAGVKVGAVDRIELRDGKAVIFLKIQKGLGLSKSSYAEFKTDGILGTKHISLGYGKPTDPPLASGDQLATVTDGNSLGGVLKQIGEVAKSLKDVSEAIKDATVNGTTDTPIGRIMTNIEMLTADLAEVSGQNKEKIGSLIDKLDGIATTLNGVLGEGSRGRVNQAFDNVYSGLDKFDEALENIREITDKVNDGEGTVGRLINDEETIDGINKVVENLNTVLGGVRTLRTSFDYHSELHTDPNEVTSFMSLKLQPGLDRYYELGLVQDPYGTKTERRVVKTGSQTEDFEETVTYKNKIKLTALFAKNFYDFTFKGGLIQSKGGFGIDYSAFNNKLKLSAEAFDFDDANVRLFARFNVYNGLYVVGGYNSVSGEFKSISSPFFGAGLFLRNDDLATLAAFALGR